jgi:hypothetical protein
MTAHVRTVSSPHLPCRLPRPVLRVASAASVLVLLLLLLPPEFLICYHWNKQGCNMKVDRLKESSPTCRRPGQLPP